AAEVQEVPRLPMPSVNPRPGPQSVHGCSQATEFSRRRGILSGVVKLPRLNTSSCQLGFSQPPRLVFIGCCHPGAGFFRESREKDESACSDEGKPPRQEMWLLDAKFQHINSIPWIRQCRYRETSSRRTLSSSALARPNTVSST